jgi:hypothetical protein
MTDHQYSYGIDYTPSNVISTLPTLGRATVDEWKALGIRYVRLQWGDLTGSTRFRVFPLASFAAMLASSRPGMAMATCILGLVNIALAPGFNPTGEDIYRPDLSSMRLCGYAPGHASVMGFFEHKAPVIGPDGAPSLQMNLCPRGILKRVVEYVIPAHFVSHFFELFA